MGGYDEFTYVVHSFCCVKCGSSFDPLSHSRLRIKPLNFRETKPDYVGKWNTPNPIELNFRLKVNILPIYDITYVVGMIHFQL